MTTTLLKNANLVRLIDDTDYWQIPNAAIVIEDQTIRFAGEQTTLPKQYQTLNAYDCQHRLITPGLIDCHTHLIYAGNRAQEFEQRLKGTSYADIASQGGGILSTVNATRAASKQQLIDQSRPRLQALMQQGVTTVEIKSGYGLTSQDEIKMLQAATELCDQYHLNRQRTHLAAHALPPEYQHKPDQYIDHICTHMLPQAVAAGVVDAVDAFCETIGFTLEQTERIFDTAQTLNLPIKCHAEQLSHQGAAAMSARYHALSVDHLEYLTEQDIQQIAQTNTTAVLLPGAYYTLKETKLPPINALRDAHIPLALATDANPGSSPIFSPLTIMNMGCTLFGLTPLETLAGFTINAAKALGLQHTLGSIETGKQADLVLWNCQHPAELSYHLGLNPLNRTMQAGQWRPQAQ